MGENELAITKCHQNPEGFWCRYIGYTACHQAFALLGPVEGTVMSNLDEQVYIFALTLRFIYRYVLTLTKISCRSATLHDRN